MVIALRLMFRGWSSKRGRRVSMRRLAKPKVKERGKRPKAGAGARKEGRQGAGEGAKERAKESKQKREPAKSLRQRRRPKPQLSLSLRRSQRLRQLRHMQVIRLTRLRRQAREAPKATIPEPAPTKKPKTNENKTTFAGRYKPTTETLGRVWEALRRKYMTDMAPRLRSPSKFQAGAGDSN